MNPLCGGGSSSRGLRAAWERRQQASVLADRVASMPALAQCKPAFFLVQLQPVLVALRQAHTPSQQTNNREEGEAAEEDDNQHEGSCIAATGEDGHQSVSGQQRNDALAQAAVQLRRLERIDEHTAANTCLLLFLLLGLAQSSEAAFFEAGSEEETVDTVGVALVQLCSLMRWQLLLREALPLLPLQQQRRTQRAMLAAVLAEAGSGHSLLGAQQHATVDWLLLRFAHHLQHQLQQFVSSTSNTGGISAALGLQEQLADAELIQQLLLVRPEAATAPTAALALQQLQATVDTCMAGLMWSMQQQLEGQRQQMQPAFQQLCQLRARIMLSMAAGGGGSSSTSQPGHDPECMRLQEASITSGAHSAQVWHQVLHMPPGVVAALADTSGAGVGGPNRQQFLAACAAARCLLQAAHGSACSMTPLSGSSSCRESSAADPYRRSKSCAALPGVLFELPALPLVQPLSTSTPACAASPTRCFDQKENIGAAAPLAIAAEEAAAGLLCDPGCLGPARLVPAALQLAAEQAPAQAAPATLAGGEQGHPSNWPLLLELAAAAATDVKERSQQRHLLLLLLHGRQPWQMRLRWSLAADASLQQHWRRELVAVANRLAAGVGSGGSAAAAVVHGEERRRRTSAAVLALLPYALLCPAAVLERVVREALVQAGEQVVLLLDVLREMAPLAAYRKLQHQQQQQATLAEEQQHPLLLHLLAQLLMPTLGHRHPAVLDTPGSREAFLQLATGLCGVVQAKARQGSAGEAGLLAGWDAPLLRAEAVLQHVVAPALQQAQQQQQCDGDAAGLLLPLQLALLLLPKVTAGSMPGLATWQQHEENEMRQQQPWQLAPLLGKLVDLESRRVDRSAMALLPAGMEAVELAADILGSSGSSLCCGNGSSSGSGSGNGGAGAYVKQQLQPLLAQPSTCQAQAQQQLQQLRRRMVRLLAALLPCCTCQEAVEMLQAALPSVIQEAMMPAAVASAAHRPGAAGKVIGAMLPGAHAAAVEAACRAARALALQPGETPIADEPLPIAAAGATGGSVAAHASVLRQAAVERMLQHLTRHCVSLVAVSDPASVSRDPQVNGQQPQEAARGLQLTAAERQALGIRCFRELCQLAAAVQPAQYDCATLQAGLLQLLQQLLQPGAPGDKRAEEPGQQPRQQSMMPLERVREQLVSEAGALPAGRLRDVAMAAIQQALG